MRRDLMVWACVAVTTCGTMAVAGDCAGCKKIQESGNGFCDLCGKGMVWGLETSNRMVYDTLASTGLSAEDMKSAGCAGCVKAIETSGKCDHCGIFFAGGEVYLCRYAHDVAMGKAVGDKAVAEKIKACPECVKKAKDGGYCSKCKAGFVAGRAYESENVFRAAEKALAVIKDSLKDAAKCEYCAQARLLDQKCDKCKISYKDGQPAKG